MRSFADRKETSENLKAPIVCAEENCHLMVHTGDLLDFVSEASIEFAREILKRERILYAAGNHEYDAGRGHEATEPFVEYANREKTHQSRACGPRHFNFESTLPNGTIQCVTGWGRQGVNGEPVLQ